MNVRLTTVELLTVMSGLLPSEFVVLCYFAAHTGANGDSVRKLETAEVETGLCRQAIARAIKKLSMNGFLEVRHKAMSGAAKRSLYRVNERFFALEVDS